MRLRNLLLCWSFRLSHTFFIQPLATSRRSPVIWADLGLAIQCHPPPYIRSLGVRSRGIRSIPCPNPTTKPELPPTGDGYLGQVTGHIGHCTKKINQIKRLMSTLLPPVVSKVHRSCGRAANRSSAWRQAPHIKLDCRFIPF